MISSHERGKKLWQGAVYLSLAAIIVKILSAVYRVPYQNIAGDLGFYVYQQIYPIYGFVIILSTYGFPVIVSRLISEGKIDRVIILRSAFYSLLMISFFSFFITFISAEKIAQFMGDTKLSSPLKAVSFSFFVIPFLSLFRGFFQGDDNMLPTALSQIVDQVIRVSAILVITYILINSGYGPYAAGVGATIASLLAGICGSIVLYFFFRRSQFQAPIFKYGPMCPRTIRIILLHGFMICFSSLLLILFQFIDSITVLRTMLQASVVEESAKVAKGVFDRGQPLIQMGTVVTTSFSLILVPLITKMVAEKKNEQITIYSQLAFRVSYIIGGAATVGFIIIIEHTNIMLFKDGSGTVILAILGLTIVMASIFITTSHILHGMNETNHTVLNVIVGVLIKLVLNITLIPKFGLAAAAVATVVGCTVSAGLNVGVLMRKSIMSARAFKGLGSVLLSFVVMAFATFLWKEGMSYLLSPMNGSRLSHSIVAISSVPIGVITFLYCIVKWNVFSEEELSFIPKISKFTMFIRKYSRIKSR